MLHVLNYGMGVDSSYRLAKWILEPDSRDFPLSRLVVLIAQTGEEYESTKRLVETHIFPLCRKHNIRVIQVARGGHFVRHGFKILSDTRQPYTLHTRHDYFNLGEYLTVNGTLVRIGRPRSCSPKAKGFPLDGAIDCLEQESITKQKCLFFKLALNLWQQPRPQVLTSPVIKLNRLIPAIAHILRPIAALETPAEFVFGPYLCYSAEEEKRLRKSEEYGCRHEKYIYPNFEEGVTRQMAIDHLHKWFGVIWERSCCDFCPFQEEGPLIERYRREPEGLAHALMLEAIAIHFNPRMYQFAFGTAWSLAHRTENTTALKLFEEQWNREKWALYHVRRISWWREKKSKPGDWWEMTDRCIKIDAIGSCTEINRKFMDLASGASDIEIQEMVDFSKAKRPPKEEDLHKFTTMPIRRIFTRRQGTTYPLVEELYFACPAVVKEKVRNATKFEQDWQREAVQGGRTHIQDTLLDLEEELIV